MNNQVVLPLTGYGSEAHLAAVLHDCRFAGGVAASAQSGAFGGMLFTRDTCRMLRSVQAHPHYRPFARELLGILPQWQGAKEDPLTNEFPDALQHQVVREFVAGRRLDQAVLDNAEYWSNIWGVGMTYDPQFGKNFVIYNSSDGPPLYLITLGEHIAKWGPDVLKDEFYHWPSGTRRTVAEAASRCADYILAMIERNDFGLYAVPNTNPKQTSPSGVMRDGWDAYFYPEGGGRLLDYSYVTYYSNQALVFSALKFMAEVILPNDERSKQWREVAEKIRGYTLDLMWEGDFPAVALDKDGNKVMMASSDVTESLNEQFYEGLQDEDFFVSSLVRWLVSRDVLTPIGPRMVSLVQSFFEEAAPGELPYCAYQLTAKAWSILNTITHSGTFKQQLFRVAHSFGVLRNLAWFRRSKAVPEETVVDRETNQPVYDTNGNRDKQDEAVIKVASAELGQPNQGWGAAGGLEIHFTWQGYHEIPEAHDEWRRDLDNEAAEMMEAVTPASADEPVDIIYVDTQEGKRIKQELARKFGAAA
jgi:hypothetical protein